MSGQDYQSTISAKIPARDAFARIGRVSEWWTRSFRGSARQVGDRFNVHFGDTFVDFEVVEAVPDRRVVWRVTGCHLHWLKNKTEWNDTKIVFDLASKDGTTSVTMTHAGLTPGVECFEDCKQEWNFYVGESLYKLFTDNQGVPDGALEKANG